MDLDRSEIRIHSFIFHVFIMIFSPRRPDIGEHFHTVRRAAIQGGRCNPSLRLPPSPERGTPSNFDTMDRSDPHDFKPPTRVPSPTSIIESDATALSVVSTTGKGGRASGFSLKKTGAGLKSILFKTVPDRLHSPRSVANQIRRLCRHDEATISQRHMVAAEHVSYDDKITLKELCRELLLIYCRRRALCRG